ncbi:bifunctional [glutamate--ammonia ligase]-adenylyl-L-tyrosine phosphorylase/[glutamate--ammonia-ligase] adenylyltransferase [Halorhodospira halochloris]|uniref:bifunctional [glutamate--ammonia ligase]-adenylyl-L-tyrosine phosphorylase/[glutamate--ammonia-ligase] adenylyltransferase n=1 Tax=Halorhodospira halochloris TaxID=1052 RepID=UPI001EE88098|nr:bifunctional [glutamate--ammonia ligase]-adenylyl-L-tyrosine phosphorylase/[glutamate--ammonia-ligase] adenylyltransferase [Halorhodospira halochloris]MCG5529296.1 bifunctional [glutamate--ammonia ligase]-adenylyl-L-tyrosine phosphorylase/[glutamate--ammonia-ligase] adenylyltransferase [Halorhodospira halochloris]
MLHQLPESLQDLAAANIAKMEAAGAIPDEPRITSTIPLVAAASDFVTNSCSENDSNLLHDLCTSKQLFEPSTREQLRARLQEKLDKVSSEEQFLAELRQYRRREAVRIAYRSLAGWADLEETLDETSEMAEAAIDLALHWLYTSLTKRWGVPRDEHGNAQQMVVLGMGKLGGHELNFSSDLDLIFAFPQQGETDGKRPRSNDEFFVKLGRQLIGALDAVTVDGRAFRIDMRLRPNGDAGPLALPFSAIETYYESQGREWERYAMIKARCVGGDYTAGDALTRDLRPFVYRRYLDYGALEQLRETKEMIVNEVRRRGAEENLKTGEGGIREVEFVAQAFQLIRGGRDANLRSRRLMKTLYYLRDQGILTPRSADELIEAYRFLRRAENAVQMLADEQSHTVPQDPVLRARVALGAGFTDVHNFEEKLEHLRAQVHDHFEQVFSSPQVENAPEVQPSTATLIWNESPSNEETITRLQEIGFEHPELLAERLRHFHDGSTVRSLSTRGRKRLDCLMPLLIGACAQARRPTRALERTLDLVDTVARRTAYLALLAEHPMALSQLVQLCDGSAWVARFITAHPLLLDELLDPRSLYEPLGRASLEEDLDYRLSQVESMDLEQQMEVVRQFKQAQQLKVAAADVSGAAPLMVVSDYLTNIAEVTLHRTIELCYQHLTRKHGHPRCGEGNNQRLAHYAVVAYGKFGGLELGYNSDLDLVFIHDSCGQAAVTDGQRPLDNQAFFSRLAQRVIHFLNTPTPGGIVYEIDTRLRPSGKAGLMSTSIEAFYAYQLHNAWTWEHQALVRARPVAGDEQLCQRFNKIRSEVLGLQRDSAQLKEQVSSMRERQRREKGSSDRRLFDIKNDRGGISDIEFIVQYLVLVSAHDHPEVVRYTDKIRLLRALADAEQLSSVDAHRLANAYRSYRRRLHQLALQDEEMAVECEELQPQREAVTELWQRIFNNNQDH